MLITQYTLQKFITAGRNSPVLSSHENRSKGYIIWNRYCFIIVSMIKWRKVFIFNFLYE